MALPVAPINRFDISLSVQMNQSYWLPAIKTWGQIYDDRRCDQHSNRRFGVRAFYEKPIKIISDNNT